MKRLLIGITGFVGLTTSSCALSLLATAIPKDLIQQSVVCPTDGNFQAENVQVVGTQRWTQGIVVLYSAVCPSDARKTSMQRVFGHKLMKRHGISWQVSGSDSYSLKSTPAKPDRLVDYRISKSVKQGSDRYIVLYGQALKPKVAMVEATFDNGQIVRDRSVNGAFALIGPGAAGVCEVRILGADHQILQQDDLVIPKQFKTKPSQMDKPMPQCLPVTHRL